MTKSELLDVLSNTYDLPTWGKRKEKAHRTIYESGIGPRLRPSGRFYVDYASYAHGTTEAVPLSLILQLESEGVLSRAFPEKPEINGWVLTPKTSMNLKGRDPVGTHSKPDHVDPKITELSEAGSEETRP